MVKSKRRPKRVRRKRARWRPRIDPGPDEAVERRAELAGRRELAALSSTVQGVLFARGIIAGELFEAADRFQNLVWWREGRPAPAGTNLERPISAWLGRSFDGAFGLDDDDADERQERQYRRAVAVLRHAGALDLVRSAIGYQRMPGWLIREIEREPALPADRVERSTLVRGLDALAGYWRIRW